MVDMMRKDQVKNLPPEIRIKNSYESLYYRANSGDPESDEIVREQIQQSFRQHGVVLSDQPDNEALRDVMLDAYKESAKSLGGDDLSLHWENNLSRDFDTFLSANPSFYTSTFEAYERKYEGETVDLIADYDRLVQDNDGVDPYFTEPTEADVDAMERDRLKQFTREGEMRAAGLSYVGHAPEVKTPIRRPYHQVRQEEMAAEEMKGQHYDKAYDQYARNRSNSYQKTTAGDAYGFDERDDELEDDGPEL